MIHEALVGASKTSAAAKDVAEAYTELVVRVWKKQLELEWWRNQTNLTSQALEMLQVAERKRKREADGNTTNKAKRITPKEIKSNEGIPNDAMDDNVDKEVKRNPDPSNPPRIISGTFIRITSWSACVIRGGLWTV